jgi:phosphoribosylformylglycinamidine cyclo-ligase
MPERPPRATASDRRAYLASGVDVTAGDRAVDLIRDAVASTRRPEVVGGLGGFAGAVALPAGLRDPLIVSATDGVGTKTAIARTLGRFDTIGLDLVAMCADDVVCIGAAPLFFLDYVAIGRLVPEQVAELVGGVARGCLEAGCALIGGETAEHPGLMGPDEFDLAGFCVGVVERDRSLDGRSVRPGDAILGFRSSGLHANGFSLVRALIGEYDLDLGRPYQEQLRRSLGDAGAVEALVGEPHLAFATLGEVLLTPTRLYARAALALRDALDAAGHDLGGLAHITGGGLPGNVPRALPETLAARLDPARWGMPSVMSLFGALGGLDDAELRATFNGGLGMIAVLPLDAVPLAIETLSGLGVPAALVGEVVPADALDGRRYVEGRLQMVGDR